MSETQTLSLAIDIVERFPMLQDARILFDMGVSCIHEALTEGSSISQFEHTARTDWRRIRGVIGQLRAESLSRVPVGRIRAAWERTSEDTLASKKMPAFVLEAGRAIFFAGADWHLKILENANPAECAACIRLVAIGLAEITSRRNPPN